MTDYTKATDFAAKDDLPTGDPEKIAFGADLDAELNAIAVAMATKANTAGLIDGLSAVVVELIAPQVTASGVTEAIAFDTETLDQEGYFDIGTPEGVTIPQDGVYLITAWVNWGTGSAGTAQIRIARNGDANAVQDAVIGTGEFNQSISTVLSCVAGNDISLYVTQTGGARNVLEATLTVARLSET